MDKPQAASARQIEKNSIIFAVTADGKVAYGGKEIGLGGVRPTVKRLCAKEALPVVIQTDQNSRSGMLIRVLDEAKLGGAKDVSLATEKPDFHPDYETAVTGDPEEPSSSTDPAHRRISSCSSSSSRPRA